MYKSIKQRKVVCHKSYRLKFLSLILIPSFLFLGSCSQVIIGGAASTGLVTVQERSAKQAGIDIIIKTKIEEAMFSDSYEELFSKIRVIVYEGKVLLVGTVESSNAKDKAENIAWTIKNVKEVANYITTGKNNLVDYVKDTRISLEFRAKLLTDQEISEINFSSTTENRILYIVGIAKDQQEIDKILNHATNIAGILKIVNLIIKKDDPQRKD